MQGQGGTTAPPSLQCGKMPAHDSPAPAAPLLPVLMSTCSDANEKNILVDAAAAEAAAAAEQQEAAVATDIRGESLITGLIDVGDAMECWVAAECAAACVYMMLLEINISNPLPAAAAIIDGYRREMDLLPEELRILRTLAMGRLVLSLSLGAHAAAQRPDNAEYLLSTQKNGWRLLRLLRGLSDEQFLAAVAPASPF